MKNKKKEIDIDLQKSIQKYNALMYYYFNTCENQNLCNLWAQASSIKWNWDRFNMIFYINNFRIIKNYFLYPSNIDIGK